VALSESYKHFGHEHGEEIGEVLIFDDDLMGADPVLAANTNKVGGASVTSIPFGHDCPGITELGYKTRREAEAIAAQHGVSLSEH
jgi:hypothetical protein